MIFNQSAALVTAGVVESRYASEPVEDWDNPVETPLDFLVSVQPSSTSEGGVERPQTVAQWRLFTPPGTDIPDLDAGSRIRLGGTLLMSVVGPAERWPDPFNTGVVHHVEATLEVVNG